MAYFAGILISICTWSICGQPDHDGAVVAAAKPAGTQLSCLYGLTGLHLGFGGPQSWAKHPVVLLQGWESIEAEQIWALGRPAHLRAVHRAQCADIEMT